MLLNRERKGRRLMRQIDQMSRTNHSSLLLFLFKFNTIVVECEVKARIPSCALLVMMLLQLPLVDVTFLACSMLHHP